MTIISHIFHSLIHILTIYKWAGFNFAHLYYMKSILNRDFLTSSSIFKLISQIYPFNKAGGSLYILFWILWRMSGFS